MRVVVDPPTSRTKTSSVPFVSPATRFVAALAKATNVPSPVDGAPIDAPFAWSPALETLTRVVASKPRLRRKMSITPFVSPVTNVVALLANATNDPFRAIEGWPEAPATCVELPATLAREHFVVDVSRSCASPMTWPSS